MNIAVIYATKTNHSKKYAEAVAQRLSVKAQNIADHPKLNDTSMLFVVGGIYGGVGSPELHAYIKGLDASGVKHAAVISSCASKKQKLNEVRDMLIEKGVNVVAEMILPGSFLFMRIGHPNSKDLQDAADFAERVANPA